MLMMRVRGRALRVVSKLMLLAMLVAALTVALVPVALADGHLQAADGQSLNDQPPDVQALYRSTYGAGAAARWVEDHNAAIGEMVMAPMPAMTDLYLTVRHVAWQRSGDAELAARIAADVMARGTAEAFLAGTDTGVVWGVWTEPEPMGMGSSSGSSSSSTSSGPATPKSPSTSMVSGWDDVTRNYVVGQVVSLTLPSSSHPDVDGYALGGSLPAGLTREGREVTGTPTTVKSTTGAYSAQDAGLQDIGEPYILTLTINVRDTDSQPDFRARSQDPISVLVEVALTTTTLPEVFGGNAPITYSVSGLPVGVTFDAANHELSGTAEMAGVYRVIYTAKDQDGDTASLNFTITVEADTEPLAPTVSNMVFTEGDEVGLVLPVGSGGNGALTYALSGHRHHADELTFVPATRWLYGNMPYLADGVDSRTWTVTYTVTDTGGADEVESTFTITVNKA